MDQCSLRVQGDVGGPVINRCQHRQRFPIVAPALDRETSLTWGRRHLIDRKVSGIWHLDAQPGQSRGRHDGTVDLSVGDLAKTRVHVPSQVDHLHSGKQGMELRAAPDAGGSDDLSGLNSAACAKNQDIARVGSSRHGADDEIIIVFGREVFR
jgi:hypothetical protein